MDAVAHHRSRRVSSILFARNEAAAFRRGHQRLVCRSNGQDQLLQIRSDQLSRTANYLWCAGMGVTGMILSKETYILHVACAAIAAGVCYISNYFNRLDDARPVKPSWNYVDFAVVVGTGVALIVFFYSGTFFHWNGIKGLYQAYLPWF